MCQATFVGGAEKWYHVIQNFMVSNIIVELYYFDRVNSFFAMALLKRENRDREKYLNKVKIVEPCDSIMSKVPILTVASHIAS